MPRGGSRGVALGLAVSVILGGTSGLVLSRMATEARAAGLPDVQPLQLASPEQIALREAVALAADVAGDPEPAPASPRPDRAACGPRDGRLVRWHVTVGKRQPVGADRFALGVQRVLCHERGWTRAGIRFKYSARGAGYMISLRSAERTERRCLSLVGLSVRETWSCAGTHEAVLNADRWFEGSPTLRMPVRTYRALLVNHEVGHLLGHGHRGCGGAGRKAPVMMQQSKGLHGCRANAWPLGYEL